MKARKIEGGQGGRKGHSNMSHYEGTEVIKRKSKRARRRIDREVADQVRMVNVMCNSSD